MKGHDFAGRTQGTTYTVTISAAEMSPCQRRQVEEAIQTRLSAIDETMSGYRPDSEISIFDDLADTAPHRVSQELLDVFQLARETSAASGGAFDVTVAPLVKAWRFGPGSASGASPGDDEIDALRERVGFHKIEIDAAASSLRKTRPDVTCSLDAIAQGYTVDILAAELDALGFGNYLVEVGGEIKARGLSPKGMPWQIAVASPKAGTNEAYRTIALTDCAVSTSGSYRNYYDKDGARISHTIDPRTGRPVEHDLASVTVVDKSCAVADAYATALMVLGPDEGYRLARERRMSVLFILGDDAGGFSEKATAGFPDVP